MGAAKQEMIRRQELGLPVDSYAEGNVCDDCFGDVHIKEFIRENAEENDCDFCGRHSASPIAADLNSVVEFINDGLRRKYEDLDGGNVPYDAEQGAYALEGDSTEDIVYAELVLPLDGDEKLANAISEGLGNNTPWVEIGAFAMGEEEHLSSSWEQFCAAIKHKVRFLFRETNRESEMPFLLSPADMLESLAHACETCELFAYLPEGTTIFRVREEEGADCWREPRDVGPTPCEKAKTENRMSPVGIPMFYGSFDAETCILETVRPPCRVALAEFRLLKTIKVLDLTDIPKVSIFDPTRGPLYHRMSFLRQFRESVTQPVDKSDLLHVEYIPTQVVTEFFRDVHPGVFGIMYPSAQNPGHSSIVIFVDQNGLEDCEDDKGRSGDKILKLHHVDSQNV